MFLNNGKYLIGKMEAKSDEAIFIGYELNSKVYRVFNKISLIVEESIHVVLMRLMSHRENVLLLMMKQILKTKILKN